MKGIVKILLLAGAGAAIYWGPTLLALYNLTCNVIAVYPTAMTGSRISAVVTVKLKNNSGTLINMQSIVADILLNGLKMKVKSMRGISATNATACLPLQIEMSPPTGHP